MPGRNLRYIPHSPSRGSEAPKVVDILEPQRVELFIHAAELAPDVTPNHQKRSGRLLDVGRMARVEIEATVVTVDPIAGPKPIHPEHLESQRHDCR